MIKTSRSGALLVALSLSLAAVMDGAEAQESTDSTAITTLYTSMLSGVGKGAGSGTVTWAMSAIGLTGGGSSQLAAISKELQEIDAELENINATLNEILDAIEEQTCTETQIAPSLQDAVNEITELYDNYQVFLDNAAMTPAVAPSQAEVLQWQNAVLDNVPSDLNDIHNGVYATVNANVIDECAVATAAPFLNAAKTSETFLDDRPSYAQLIDIVNFYYGVQVQGATILAEAYHLQACQAAAEDDPDLHCDFSTASTSTSASEVNEICDNPTDIDVQRACLAAQEAVTDPDSGTGMYEHVEAQLTAAGAPYATGEAVTDDPRQVVTGEIGLLSSIESNASDWSKSSAYLFPKDLLDFTNTATLNGQTIADCPAPLTSKTPCGPVGRFDANFDTEMLYAGFTDWRAVTADVLLLLFEPYNGKSTGGFDASGVLGDYMYSIGFSAATKTNGLIVTTANTGKNKDTGLPAICFADTAAPRDKAEQPWCDGIQGEVQGTDNLIDSSSLPWVQSKYLDSIGSYPEWYALDINSKGEFKVAPGWFVQVQEGEAGSTSVPAFVDQFHWPMVDVSRISCQQAKPFTNPGGLLSRCGDGLQAYVDALLPPPDSDTTALAASSDSTLYRAHPNTNDGANALLELAFAGGDELNEVVIRFSEQSIERFLDTGEFFDTSGITAAMLRLTVEATASDWKAWKQLVTVRPLPDAFVEGNGSVAEFDRGTGTGATWRCAEDADISDHVRQCVQKWTPYRRAVARRHGGATQLDPEIVRNDDGGATVRMSWDVTADVQAGFHAWILRKKRDQHGANLAFHSREGAAAERDPTRAPTLLLER